MGVVVEITYDTEIEGSKVAQEAVQRSLRMQLDSSLRGSATLDDLAGTKVIANVLTVDGVGLVTRALEVDRHRVEFTLSDEDVKKITDGGQTLPDTVATAMVTRSVRLVPSGMIVPDYVNSSLAIAVVSNAQDLQTLGLDAVLKSQGGTVVTATELTADLASVANQVAWQPAHIAVDGSFSVSLPKVTSAGWLWRLTGKIQLLGFVPDELSQPRSPLVLALPTISAYVGEETSPHEVDCKCASKVPSDITEAELANNPDIYSEDPGAFCHPFTNPERIVSEKAFSVIARSTQPAVGPVGSRRMRGLDVLQLEGDQLPARRSVSTETRRRSSSLRSRGPSRGRSFPPLGLALAKLDLLPHRHALLSRYDDLLRRLPGGRRLMDEEHPLQWEDEIAQYQATEVALGHILDFRVRWRSNGYSLGTVAKTLTLAPRQTRRIQKIEWRRSERARRREQTSLDDEVNDQVVRERDFFDAVAAHLDEWATGESSSRTKAAAGGIGFALPGVIGGIGGGAASAHSTSHQEGGRDTTASETQRLRDAVRRHGDSLRKFESTVVTEVTQEESVTGTTEVVRNLNYAHSLTVIYYQILRHLKIKTELAGVRQCIFVPFALRPFDLQRAYRWRESISGAIRTPRFGRALRYLKDVATNFSTSDIDPGPRANQPLTYVRGSLYVTLGVERPADSSDGKFDTGLWQVAQPLLSTPALGIFSTLATLLANQRDAQFQKDYAPGMAARWADRLTFQLPGGRVLRADCTLATRYRFNQPTRIDFSIPSAELTGLTRSTVSQLRIIPALGLPPGSVANLSRISITYSTPRFEHSVEGRTGTDDLVTPITGAAEVASAVLPLDSWEKVDERLELIRSVQELIEHLNEHVEYYHKAIWWRLDRDRLLMMLDGFYVPGTNNVSIASIVDREPLAIIGNSLVYRVGAAAFVPMGKITSPQTLLEVYAERSPVADPLYISLPTDGLYAQTIMDECGALEEHYGNTDWALNDADPELGAIDPMLLGSRATDSTATTQPTPFPSTIINLQNAPDAPAPQGLAGVLSAVTNANAFRDMAGLAGTQANARAALETAAGLATNFGNQAASLELAKLAKAAQATNDADRKLASIKNAQDKGLATDEQAAVQTQAALSAMNPDAVPSDAPHTNAAINDAIVTAASVPGSSIEATNSEGATKVTLGKEDVLLFTPRILDIETNASLRSFGPPNDFTGVTKLSIRALNLPSGSTLVWSNPSAAAGRYSLTQTTTSGTSEVTISGIHPGRTDIDVEARDAGGVVISKKKFPLSIPQFIEIDDSNADLDAFIANNNLGAIQTPILNEARSVVELLHNSTSNVRLLWKSKGASAPAHVGRAFVTTAKIGNVDVSGRGLYGETRPGPAALSTDVGDTVFDESIEIFPQSYLTAGTATSDVNAAVNELARAITSLQASNPDYELWLIRFFGRLIGETLAHEIFHSLLPVPFFHNVDASGKDVDTPDIMDDGSHRSFLERTGIAAASSLPADLLDNLTDTSTASINRLTGANLKFLQTTFPVPPVKPFDT
ncbi:hypothetical protein [Arthrobacter sp. NPDC056727]|uniref:hypothetical protein n=1 Tax=Arthrobacter sp. NPDC056727 TaxID=3345927 RepID=UPI00366C6C24